MSRLAEIIAYKRKEIEPWLAHTANWGDRAAAAGLYRGFRKSLASGELGFIGEVKRASPSAGVIAEDFDPVQTALACFCSWTVVWGADYGQSLLNHFREELLQGCGNELADAAWRKLHIGSDRREVLSGSFGLPRTDPAESSQAHSKKRISRFMKSRFTRLHSPALTPCF